MLVWPAVASSSTVEAGYGAIRATVEAQHLR